MSLADHQRESERLAFLGKHGWASARRQPLTVDASTRRYERLTMDGHAAMFMDASPNAEPPPCPPNADEDERNALGWNAQSRLAASRVEAFVAIASHLKAIGLSAPTVYAFDLEHGFALIEDFGDSIFARIIETGEDEAALYEAAACALAVVHQVPAPNEIPVGDQAWRVHDYDALALRVNAELFPRWAPQYDAAIAFSDRHTVRWESALNALISQALSFPRAMILRDYHAENLIWLPDRTHVKRVGLLDFQDAVNGWGEWDFAMLLQDARRTVSEDASERAIQAYLDRTGGARSVFDERLAVLGALNALRVAGIFSRLVMRDGKDKYRQFQPRQFHLLSKNLQHPALSEMKSVVHEMAPNLMEN